MVAWWVGDHLPLSSCTSLSLLACPPESSNKFTSFGFALFVVSCESHSGWWRSVPSLFRGLCNSISTPTGTVQLTCSKALQNVREVHHARVHLPKAMTKTDASENATDIPYKRLLLGIWRCCKEKVRMDGMVFGMSDSRRVDGQNTEQVQMRSSSSSSSFSFVCASFPFGWMCGSSYPSSFSFSSLCVSHLLICACLLVGVRARKVCVCVPSSLWVGAHTPRMCMPPPPCGTSLFACASLLLACVLLCSP